MRAYPIYPMRGKAAGDYLLRLGCSVDTERLVIPDALLVTPTSNGATYAVMRGGATVFCMQYYPSNRWRVVVPMSYRISFSELAQSYNMSEEVTKGIIGSSDEVSQLLRNLPVRRSVAIAALKRFSDHTGHPYDLENVRVVLTDLDE